jgi:hypothetical protein
VAIETVPRKIAVLAHVMTHLPKCRGFCSLARFPGGYSLAQLLQVLSAVSSKWITVESTGQDILLFITTIAIDSVPCAETRHVAKN